MNGTIHFESEVALAKFLKEFTGSTAVFEVSSDCFGYTLTFTGGF